MCVFFVTLHKVYRIFSRNYILSMNKIGANSPNECLSVKEFEHKYFIEMINFSQRAITFAPGNEAGKYLPA